MESAVVVRILRNCAILTIEINAEKSHPEGERSHTRCEAIELKMNFRIWTTLLNMIWVEL
jgi:hypothetical protein